MRPMLATRAPTCPPAGVAARGEVGRHAGARRGRADGGSCVRSRNENDVTVVLPRAAQGSPRRPRRAARRRGGRVRRRGARRSRRSPSGCTSREPRRAEALARANPVTLLVFDLLRLDGEDLTGRPLEERRRGCWSRSAVDGPHWQVPPTYDDGQMLLDATAEQGLEGIVSKRRTSRYHPGRRSHDWLKFPHRPTGVVRRRRLAARDRQQPPARRGAGGRARPPTGCSTAAGSAAGSPARRGSGCRPCSSRCAADRSPFADEVPRVDAKGTVLGAPGGGVDVASLGVTAGAAAAAAELPRGPHRPRPPTTWRQEPEAMAEERHRRGRRPHPQDQQPGQGDVPRARAPPRARCCTTTPRWRRCCCRTSPTGR